MSLCKPNDYDRFRYEGENGWQESPATFWLRNEFREGILIEKLIVSAQNTVNLDVGRTISIIALREDNEWCGSWTLEKVEGRNLVFASKPIAVGQLSPAQG